MQRPNETQINRFNDPKFVLSDFGDEVWVKCPKCGKRAIDIANHENAEARVTCAHCGFNKTESSIVVKSSKIQSQKALVPHSLLRFELWLKLPFGDKVVWALNDKHLDYLESYISAYLRESPNRTGFTMVEKLPKFMQYAKNKEPLLKLFQKMRSM